MANTYSTLASCSAAELNRDLSRHVSLINHVALNSAQGV